MPDLSKQHAEVYTRLKYEQNARMRLKLLAVTHFIEGKSRYQIASFLKVSRTSVNRWISAYLTQGINGLKEKKHPGRPPALDDAQQAQLKLFLNKSLKNDSHQLHGKDIQLFIFNKFGVMYEKTAIYRLLNRLGYSLKTHLLRML